MTTQGDFMIHLIFWTFTGFSHLCIQTDFWIKFFEHGLLISRAAVNESVRLCFRHGSETAAPPPPPPPDSCHRHHPRREPRHWRSSVFGGGGGGGGAKSECGRLSGSPQRLLADILSFSLTLRSNKNSSFHSLCLGRTISRRQFPTFIPFKQNEINKWKTVLM